MLYLQAVEATSAKQLKGKGGKESKETTPAPPPTTSVQDPLAMSAALDPLSAALLDPLSATSMTVSDFGGKKEV